jgi:hypothetical protein
MVYRYTSDKDRRKILCGYDTDVSDCVILKYHSNKFLCVSTIIDEESDVICPDTIVWTKDEFQKHFDLQYGSPMIYINKEDFEWMNQD